MHAIDVGLVVLHNGVTLGASGAPGIMETAEAIKAPEESLETAVRAALSGVQDLIADASTEPWPGTRSQPNPDARVTGDTITMWVGDDDNRSGPATATSAWPRGCTCTPLANDLEKGVRAGLALPLTNAGRLKTNSTFQGRSSRTWWTLLVK